MAEQELFVEVIDLALVARDEGPRALADGGLFVLLDGKDGKIMVPADKIGYVEFSGVEERRVGFGSL